MSNTASLSTIHQHVMWNRLISVVEEQAQMRSARGSEDRYAGDFRSDLRQ